MAAFVCVEWRSPDHLAWVMLPPSCHPHRRQWNRRARGAIACNREERSSRSCWHPGDRDERLRRRQVGERWIVELWSGGSLTGTSWTLTSYVTPGSSTPTSAAAPAALTFRSAGPVGHDRMQLVQRYLYGKHVRKIDGKLGPMTQVACADAAAEKRRKQQSRNSCRPQRRMRSTRRR